jgi:hypothetical protein
VFVHSTARTAAAATARAKKLHRACDDLQRVERGLGSRRCPDAAAVSERITAISRARRVTVYLRTEVGVDLAAGEPTLARWFDHAALDAEAAADGWYALLTTLPADLAVQDQLLTGRGAHALEDRPRVLRYQNVR